MKIRPAILSIAAVIALSFALNIAFLLATPPQPPQQDALSYDIIARLLVGYPPAIQGIQDKTIEEAREIGLQGLFRRGLIYPVFLGAAYRTVGSPDFRVACFVQAFVLPLTVLLTFLLGRAAFDWRTGFIGAVLYALYLPAVWHTSFLLTETVLSLLFTLMLWLMALFLKHERPLVGLLAGIVAGLVGVSHPVWLIMPAVILVSLYYHYRLPGDRWRVLRKSAFMILGMGLVLVPWNAARVLGNLPQLGEGGTGFGAGGGFTFYVGSRVETRGMTVPEDYVVVETYFPREKLRELHEKVQRGEISIEPILLAIIEEKLASADKNDWTLTDFDYYRAGIENWLHKPFRTPELLGYKIYWYLLDIATSPSYPLPHNAFHNPFWRTVFQIWNWPVVLLATAGLVFVWKRRRELIPLFVPLAFHTVSVLLTYPDNRYKYPDLSAALLLVAFAAPRVWEWTRSRVGVPSSASKPDLSDAV